jgi:hypothetical protein
MFNKVCQTGRMLDDVTLPPSFHPPMCITFFKIYLPLGRIHVLAIVNRDVMNVRVQMLL